MKLVLAPLRLLSRDGQERARHNAAVACAALAERARERREVEEWLALRLGQPLPAPGARTSASTSS